MDSSCGGAGTLWNLHAFTILHGFSLRLQFLSCLKDMHVT